MKISVAASEGNWSNDREWERVKCGSEKDLLCHEKNAHKTCVFVADCAIYAICLWGRKRERRKIFLECQFSAAAFGIIKILLSNFRGEHNMHHTPKIASVILFRLLKSAAAWEPSMESIHELLDVQVIHFWRCSNFQSETFGVFEAWIRKIWKLDV